MYGPGKYDQLCEQARLKSKARGAMLIIIEGNQGEGFSVQAPIDILFKVPAILRLMADQIERDIYEQAQSQVTKN
jgi:hypothetical protein